MADRWLGWCDTNERETILRLLNSHDPQASLSFASSAYELRCGLLQAREPVGAIVGLVGGGVSAINVAAAIVRDASAREVVLVDRNVSDELRSRAREASIDVVLDASAPALGDKITPRQETAEASVVQMPVITRREEHPVPAYEDLDQPTPTMIILPSPDPVPVYRAPQEIRMTKSEERPERGETRRDQLDARIPQVDGPRPPLELLSSPEFTTPRDVSPATHGRESNQARFSSNATPAPSIEVPWEEDEGGTGGAAPVIVLVSGRGGVGKTSLIATMATAAASWGMDVGLVDLDLGAGNLYGHFGAATPADLSVLAQYEQPTHEDVLACCREVAEHVRLWGACELPEMAETVMPKAEAVLTAARASCDLVLVDTSVALTDAVAQAIQTCDRLVIVVDGRPGSSAAQRQLGALAVRLGVARTRIARLANRCGPRGRNEPIINRAEIGLETARPLKVLEGGAEVDECLGEGKPQELFDLGSKFAESSATALATLLSELGALPQVPEAQAAMGRGGEQTRRGFGHRKKAV